ncbi:MAG: phosphoglucosamine mutase [Ruminococcaceae bacterium]|nr:phosphoglucosamine mutase [Oscillospiraceae bacterium]
MGRLFGTDGVRGVANSELTPELAYKIGRAGAYVLASEATHKPRILVGKDTRISGGLLEAALVAGICSVGADAVIAGVIPTPAIAYLVKHENFDAGVMISASHNPFEHNGIKYFSNLGYKLSDATEERIENIILDNSEEIKNPTHEKIGEVFYDNSLCDKYIEFAQRTVSTRFDGLKIAIDCANGSSSVTAEKTLKALGAEVIVLNNEPNGININDDCGSTHIEKLCEFVKNNQVDLGLAFDGDADRVLAVDECGELVDGDKIMSVCAMEMRKKGSLKKDTVVATVMSNLGLFVMGEKNGLNIEKTKVGDRYVLEKMLDEGYSLGGEQSGHIIFLEHNTTGDGLVTGLQLTAIVKETGKKLSELAQIMQVYPQVLINAKVKSENKDKYLEDEEIRLEIEKIEKQFMGDGRVLIRPSGTEPLVRVMIEGKDQSLITEKAKCLADLIVKKLG